MPTGHYTRTDAHRAAISAGQRRRLASSPEVKAKICANLIHDKSDPRWKPADHAANSASRKKWWSSLSDDDRRAFTARRGVGVARHIQSLSRDERRARFKAFTDAGTAATKAMWAALSAEEKAAKLRPIWQASQSANPSSIELIVKATLDALGVRYRHQAFIGRHLVDFYIKSKRLVIECDGSYWHGLPGRPDNDARRDAWFREHGFSILRLGEKEIRAGEAARKLASIAV